MNLSQNFTLAEMCRSETAIRYGIDNTPDSVVTNNLRRLCTLILEPLRSAVGRPIRITSGYRSPKVNQLIGGARNSAHVFGLAADIEIDGLTPLEVCREIKILRLPYDQTIHEFREWSHVAIAQENVKPRLMELTAVKQDGMTVYQPGLLA